MCDHFITPASRQCQVRYRIMGCAVIDASDAVIRSHAAKGENLSLFMMSSNAMKVSHT